MRCLCMPSDGPAKGKGAALVEGTSAGISCGKGSRVVAQAVSQAITGAEAIAGVTGAWTEVGLRVGVVAAMLTGVGARVVALGVPGT